MLFEDLGVLSDEILAAVGADGHGLSSLDGSAVLVHLDTSTGGVGLLVLALNTVLLGDRHGEMLWLCGGRVCCVVFVIVVENVGAAGKLGDLDLDLELGEDPSLFYFCKIEGNFWSRSNTTARQNATAKLEARISRGEPHLNAFSSLLLFSHIGLLLPVYIRMIPNKTGKWLLHHTCCIERSMFT